MTEIFLTRHSLARIQQRGIAMHDPELVMLIGTPVNEGYFVRKKDCDELVHALKHLIRRVERLKGKRIVLSGNRLITAYHAKKSCQRELMRRANQCDLVG